MTINRVTLENGNVQFEDFAASSAVPHVGMALELPMCGSGWTVGRFKVVSVVAHPIHANMVVAEAKRVR